MDQGEEILKAIMKDEASALPVGRMYGPPPAFPEDTDEHKDVLRNTSIQWAVSGGDKFLPIGQTIPKLIPGVYTPFISMGNPPGMERVQVNSDGVYTLPDTSTEIVLREIESFWNNEHLYREHNLLYKRGVLLWGPPGAGKSISIKLLMNEIMRRDGIVILVNHVQSTIAAMKEFRKIEPKRNVILVFEDIDEIINDNGEATVLSLLDGEHNIDCCLNLASTNFPERLGARIINRPSRFDRRIYVDMPSINARKEYLTQATKGSLTENEMAAWLKDSEGMSIAHLRELVAAVYCLQQKYEDVIDRLKSMAHRPKADGDGFARREIGLKSNAKSSANDWLD